MAIQTRDLVLTALGTREHEQPPELRLETSSLEYGIHLRWAFARALGFPWFGFHLYRRHHEVYPPVYMGEAIGRLDVEQNGPSEVTLESGGIRIHMRSDQSQSTAYGSSQWPCPGIELGGRDVLYLDLPEDRAAHQIELNIHFLAYARFRVTGLLWDRPVVERIVEGSADQTVRLLLEADAITEVVIRALTQPGPAVLQDIGLVPVYLYANANWDLVSDFTYPLSLPVDDSAFPYPGAPRSHHEAVEVALQRIVYGDPGRWVEPFVESLYEQLVNMVEGGPGMPMAERSFRLSGTPARSEPDVAQPNLPSLYPLDLALLAAIQPAVAQMLGLYWLDRDVAPDLAYDYLILADYAGHFEGQSHVALDILRSTDPEWLAQIPAEELCAYIAFGRSLNPPADPLPPPEEVRVYALPGSGMPIEGHEEPLGLGNAGLCWEHGVSLNADSLSTQPVMYHVWRLDLEDRPPIIDDDVPAEEYRLLTEEQPTVVSRTDSPEGKRQKGPADWPSFALQYLDCGLREGWYSYRLSGIDLFGRHSRLSRPAAWHRWAPAHELEALPGAERGVCLGEDESLPPPTSVEASVLDPDDRNVLQDDTYTAWRKGRDSQVGLRVRWQWTHRHQQQAPGVNEFVIRYQPGQLNALAGRTRIVGFDGTRCRVEVILGRAMAIAKLPGTLLRIGSETYHVLEAKDNPLRLWVDCGEVYRPAPGESIKVVQGMTEVEGSNSRWHRHQAGLELRVAGEHRTYTILQVDHQAQPQKLFLDQPYEDSTGTRTNYELVGRLPKAHRPCTLVIPPAYTRGTVTVEIGSKRVTGHGSHWTSALEGSLLQVLGDDTEYEVGRVHTSTSLTLTRAFEVSDILRSHAAYRIGPHPLFTDYADAGSWLQKLEQVPYTKQVVERIPPWRGQNGELLQGNCAQYSWGMVTLGTGDSDRPDLTGIPWGQLRLWLEADTGRADRMYRLQGYNASTATVTIDPTDGIPNIPGPGSPWVIGPFLSLRQYEVFLPAPASLAPSLTDAIVYGHVGVHAVGVRAANGPVGAPAKVFRVHRGPVSPPEPPKDGEKVMASSADYHSRSFYTMHWETKPHLRAHLKAHVYRALDQTLFEVDWAARSNKARPSLDFSKKDHRKLFPMVQNDPRWNDRKRKQVAAELNHLNDMDDVNVGEAQAMAHYRGLSNDALRVLAGLPGNETAFSQVTVKPLECDRFNSYEDTLDGRTTSRYFYRVALLDDAHNRSDLSLSGAPVYLPDVVPPRPPTLNRVAGGNSEISLYWNAVAETGVAAYHIYRTKDAAAARSVRAMRRVGVVQAPGTLNISGDKPGRSTLDSFYRVVPLNAADEEGTPEPPFSVSLMVDPDNLAQSTYEVRWAPNRNAGHSACRLYRGHKGIGVDEIDKMTAVATTQLSPLRWTEKVPALITFYYRVVAIDGADNVSAPSEVVAARAYDAGPPIEPNWERVLWVRLDAGGKENPWTGTAADLKPAVALVFTTPQAGVTALVQRKENDNWQNVTPWLREPKYHTGKKVWRYSAYDRGANPTQELVYRIKMISPAGMVVEMKTEHKLAAV